MQVARWALMRRFLSVCGRNANRINTSNSENIMARTMNSGQKILEFLLNGNIS